MQLSCCLSYSGSQYLNSKRDCLDLDQWIGPHITTKDDHLDYTCQKEACGHLTRHVIGTGHHLGIVVSSLVMSNLGTS
jgi:hypothetical protein